MSWSSDLRLVLLLILNEMFALILKSLVHKIIWTLINIIKKVQIVNCAISKSLVKLMENSPMNEMIKPGWKEKFWGSGTKPHINRSHQSSSDSHLYV